MIHRFKPNNKIRPMMEINNNHRTIFIAVVASFATAILTVLGIRYFESPREIVLRDGSNARYALSLIHI